MVSGSPFSPSPANPPPPPPQTAAGRPSAAARRPRAIRAVRSARTAQIRKGGVPLQAVHGGPVDQVHRAGPPLASRLRHRLRHARVITSNHSPPRGAPIAHPPAAQAFLQKEPCIFHNYKYTLPPI
jgi:hypothetical protein